MTTSIVTLDERSALLRRALRLDAAFSAASGLLSLLAAGPLAAFIGLPSPLILIGLGVGLLGYALMNYRSSARPVSYGGAIAAVVLNVLWVIGSAMLLLSDWAPLTAGGKWAVAIAADVVGLFAIAQFVGLRRLARGSAA